MQNCLSSQRLYRLRSPLLYTNLKLDESTNNELPQTDQYCLIIQLIKATVMNIKEINSGIVNIMFIHMSRPNTVNA